jgi:hypothetical protein
MLCGSGAVSLVRNDSENAVRRRDVSDGARLGPPPSARASIQVGFDLAVPTRVDAEGFADSRLKDVDRQGLEAVRHSLIIFKQPCAGQAGRGVRQ